ncbi:MAG TPA: hypothetical protein VNN17_04910 [Terriglobia bacterium]|nr:hypothetical protein [Terriglobia bacterium]
MKKTKARAASSRPESTNKPAADSRSRVAKTAPAKTSPKARTQKTAAEPAPVYRRQPTAEEIAHQQDMERFENALQLFNQNQLARARTLFEKLKEHSSPELAQRAGVYLRICDQRLTRTTVQLKTAEDYYNYAVSLANEGRAEESEQHLLKALKLAPKADYLYYALATTCALREDVEGALQYLQKAIELNERNRFQAQNDSDFASLLEDPRFTELLYPEKPLP